MAGNVDPLRGLFLDISQEILEEEQRSLYGLVKGKQIPARTLQGLADTNELFIKLEELGHIGYTNLTLLKGLLGKINREPLVRLVEELKENSWKTRLLVNRLAETQILMKFNGNPLSTWWKSLKQDSMTVRALVNSMGIRVLGSSMALTQIWMNFNENPWYSQ
ncbi:uncharacterized protein [Ptychodera flava]|uniref:uncharacterized protein n=1 Tax=Ptychodera flava TaxID=63121 RepID=UPI00396AA30D